jgi:superfamily II RNA helicase
MLLPCQGVVSLHAELSCLQVDGVTSPDLSRSGELRHGDQESGRLALAVAHMARRHDMTTAQYDLAGEVLAQVRLVQELEDQLEGHPAHRWGDRKQLKKHRRRMEDLEHEIGEREQLLHHRSNRHWETFLALIEILRHFGCLDDLEPTEIGRTVAALRGDNELWLGLALMSGHLDELPPAELAAVFEAISTEVNRPDLWSAFPAPPLAEEALHDLSGIRRELLRAQDRFKVVVPAWWEPELMGLVEAWAKGTTWNDLIANTSLDEGDVVRIMRRTVDLLAQVPYCEAISEQLRKNARAALTAINRFPVAEADQLLKAAAAESSGLNAATERAA